MNAIRESIGLVAIPASHQRCLMEFLVVILDTSRLLVLRRTLRSRAVTHQLYSRMYAQHWQAHTMTMPVDATVESTSRRMPVLISRPRPTAKRKNGIHAKTKETNTASNGTPRLFVLRKHARNRIYQGCPGPPFRRMVKLYSERDAMYKFELAQVSAVNIRKTFRVLASPGILLSSATSAKADTVGLIPPCSELVTQLIRGTPGSSRTMFSERSTLARTYTTPAIVEM